MLTNREKKIKMLVGEGEEGWRSGGLFPGNCTGEEASLGVCVAMVHEVLRIVWDPSVDCVCVISNVSCSSDLIGLLSMWCKGVRDISSQQSFIEGVDIRAWCHGSLSNCSCVGCVYTVGLVRVVTIVVIINVICRRCRSSAGGIGEDVSEGGYLTDIVERFRGQKNRRYKCSSSLLVFVRFRVIRLKPPS